MRRVLRLLITAVASTLVGAVLFPVAGEFFVEVAREMGLYEHPTQRLETFISWFSSFVMRPWFLMAMAFSVGLALNTWIEPLFRRGHAADQSSRGSSRASTDPVVSESATARPVDEKASLPTAAELLEEAELRDTLRAIREFIEGSGNDARSDLGGLITQVATLYSHQGSKHSKALKFFVQDAVNHGYGSEMKKVIMDIKRALHDRSMEHAQQNLAKFVHQYQDGQRRLGILVTGTSVDLASVKGYDRWLRSDDQCVREFRELASRPLLKASEPIKAALKFVVKASERDFSNIYLENAVKGHLPFYKT